MKTFVILTVTGAVTVSHRIPFSDLFKVTADINITLTIFYMLFSRKSTEINGKQFLFDKLINHDYNYQKLYGEAG